MNDSDGRIDLELRAAGERWRSRRKASSALVDPQLFAGAPSRTRPAASLIASLAGAAALGLVLAVVVLKFPADDAAALRGLPLPADRIRTVSLEPVPPGSEAYAYRQSGPWIVFLGDMHEKLYLADLRSGALTVIATNPPDGTLFAADISGNRVVWMDGHYAFYQPQDVRCPGGRDLRWRLLAADLPGGETRVLATGRHFRMAGACGPRPPAFALDGDLLAYTVESPQPDAPLASQIRTLSLETERPGRVIDTDLEVVQLDVDGSDIAFLTGPNDPETDEFDLGGKRLLLSTAEHPEPVEVAISARHLSFSGGRLAWLDLSGASEHDYLTADMMNLTARRPSVGEKRVTAGDGLLSWVDIIGTTTDQVVVWDQQTQRAHHLEPTTSALHTSTEDGWLTWLTFDDKGGLFLHGLPLAELNLPSAP